MTMEPNNIENQFREKLNAREIKPSEKSWDRLDAMLTVADPSVSELAKQKPKRNYRWIYFAASFLGFILIGTIFLSQTQEVIDSEHQEVVFGKDNIEAKENALEKFLDVSLENKVVENTVTSERVVTKQKSKVIMNPKISQLSEEQLPNEVALVSEIDNSSSPIINQKTEVKYVNIDALLASVEKENPNQSNVKNTVAVKVNSNDLLSQVDGELELSFREKVIQSVNKKYKEVKVAVAKRNLK